MYDFKAMFPSYDVTEEGVVLRDGVALTPFVSNKYYQVVIFDKDHRSHTFGVHTVVAMRYLDYFDGCVVHHEDGDCRNNCVSNLEVMTRQEHSRKHNKNNRTLAEYVQLHGPANKGKVMSDSFRMKCSESAKKRGFTGNQYIDKYGNRRQPTLAP